MTKSPEESRSWPEGAEADEAVEALKSGLQRLRSHVADFRHQIGADGADGANEHPHEEQG